jgi:ATP-dependent DNA helicase RecG
VDKTFEGPLLRVAEQVPLALSGHIGGVRSKFSSENWKREERVSYPQTALREGIMNALVHRDYSLSGSITILVLPKSLQISSPGGLPAELKPADLKRDHLSIPRNPDIAHICFLHRLIEKIGRGTQRIIEDCRIAHLREPKWQSSSLETTLTLYSPSISSLRDTELNVRQKQILGVLHGKTYLTAVEIARMLSNDVTDRTVRTDLQVLVDAGLLTRHGRGRSTMYILSSPEVATA